VLRKHLDGFRRRIGGDCRLCNETFAVAGGTGSRRIEPLQERKNARKGLGVAVGADFVRGQDVKTVFIGILNDPLGDSALFFAERQEAELA